MVIRVGAVEGDSRAGEAGCFEAFRQRRGQPRAVAAEDRPETRGAGGRDEVGEIGPQERLAAGKDEHAEARRGNVVNQRHAFAQW